LFTSHKVEGFVLVNKFANLVADVFVTREEYFLKVIENGNENGQIEKWQDGSRTRGGDYDGGHKGSCTRELGCFVCTVIAL
jgi:hypothetical protein